MQLVNKTDENIFVFAGIFVPANGMLPVLPESEEAVRSSPLVKGYVAGKQLELLDTPVAEEPVESPPAPAAAQRPSASTKAPA